MTSCRKPPTSTLPSVTAVRFRFSTNDQQHGAIAAFSRSPPPVTLRDACKSTNILFVYSPFSGNKCSPLFKKHARAADLGTEGLAGHLGEQRTGLLKLKITF